jgi:hypothetical protein
MNAQREHEFFADVESAPLLSVCLFLALGKERISVPQVFEAFWRIVFDDQQR